MDIRQFFFKSRSYTPIPIVCLIIYFSEQSTTYLLFGVLLISFGELIRINAVRYAGGATRTRSVGAPFLCTSGPYSYTRNPLYCGNVIIYLGFVFFSGGVFMWEISILTILFFVFQYYHIISLEEETLIDIFDNDYKTYKKNVPKLFPKLKQWKNKNKIEPLNIYKTIKTEKRTLQNIFIISAIIIYKKEIVEYLYLAL